MLRGDVTALTLNTLRANCKRDDRDCPSVAS